MSESDDIRLSKANEEDENPSEEIAERGRSGFSNGDLCNMNDYLAGLITAMLNGLASRSVSFKESSASIEEWKNELKHGAELWGSVVTDDYPDDDNVTIEEWQAERKEKLHKAVAWLEENYFDLWD